MPSNHSYLKRMGNCKEKQSTNMTENLREYIEVVLKEVSGLVSKTLDVVLSRSKYDRLRDLSSKF